MWSSKSFFACNGCSFSASGASGPRSYHSNDSRRKIGQLEASGQCRGSQWLHRPGNLPHIAKSCHKWKRLDRLVSVGIWLSKAVKMRLIKKQQLLMTSNRCMCVHVLCSSVYPKHAWWWDQISHRNWQILSVYTTKYLLASFTYGIKKKVLRNLSQYTYTDLLRIYYDKPKTNKSHILIST